MWIHSTRFTSLRARFHLPNVTFEQSMQCTFVNRTKTKKLLNGRECAHTMRLPHHSVLVLYLPSITFVMWVQYTVLRIYVVDLFLKRIRSLTNGHGNHFNP
jgi:hypothetical protein